MKKWNIDQVKLDPLPRIMRKTFEEGKYSEKEHVLLEEEKKNGEGKGGKYLEKEKVMTDRQMYKNFLLFPSVEGVK